MDIKLAVKENIGDLYSLWNICFGDDKATIDMFFKHSFDLDNTVVCVDSDRVIAMAYLVPETIVAQNYEYKAYYLYALGTAPNYRKQGIMAKVLEFIDKLAINRNIDYLYLVPASEKLFEYYKNNGYQNAFCQKKLILNKQTINKLKSSEGLKEIDFNSSTYKTIRRENINSNSNMLEKSFVDWRTNEIELAFDYFNTGSGELIATQYGSCFVEHNKNCDRIYDLIVYENKICQMLNTISNHIISEKIELHLSKNHCLIGNNQEFYNCGMVKKLKPNLDDLESTFMGIILQ